MTKVMRTMDGNEAAAYTAYAVTEVAAIYPITPSSPVADFTDVWASQGKQNLFGMPVKVVEMQSEGGAAGAVHGSLQSGALTTTFTASQGLLLKVPNMYKIAGQLLPGVIHVSARSIANHALSIFGDHSDVYAVRQTGFALLSSGSVQQVMDLGGIAHLAAIKGRVPFLHFFDGFRTSHEMQKIEVMDYAVFDRLLDRKALQQFRDASLSPDDPKTRGGNQNDDVFFQNREACNRFYDAIPDIVADYMAEISKETGREYKPFVYYGHPEAERLIIAMGSVTECTREVIDHLNAQGEKVGMVQVHLYRPFSVKYLMDVVPESVKKIAVLDRTKESGSVGEPLYLDVRGAFYGRENAPIIVGGRYGLSSKDVDPGQVAAVFENLKADAPKNDFTIGIEDDVTFKSLSRVRGLDLTDATTRECLFYGLGADGTVGANKSSVKIIGEATDLYAQAYFAYDSKKSGGFTRSYLRFGKNPIRATYYVAHPHFVACSVAAYLEQYEVVDGIREGGVFLLNSIWDAKETVRRMPDRVKRILARQRARFYILNATALAEEIGLGKRSNPLLQSAFFKRADIIDYEKAQALMKAQAQKSYGNKGEQIVAMNCQAIDVGAERLVEVPVDPAWADLPD
ncbi:MAG: pyruvate:ferredoxin (flavodoxin) oxidoreductase, partial [Zoogloeaceae bacterium]|nr:pyruvate:ferredoxin (flavodoxin) oxidoreductase [Zoogloeaceae bacterium]